MGTWISVGFLLQCLLVFQQKAHSFHDDFYKVSYLFGLLQGKVLAWVEAVSSCTHLRTMHYTELEQANQIKNFVEVISLKAVFDHLDQSRDSSTHLLALVPWQTLVEIWTSGWNECTSERFLAGTK